MSGPTATYNATTIVIYMIIDEVMEENEEEEDLNNIPLFASSEEMEEPPSLVESSLTLPERDSAPQAVSTSFLNSEIRP